METEIMETENMEIENMGDMVVVEIMRIVV